MQEKFSEECEITSLFNESLQESHNVCEVSPIMYEGYFGKELLGYKNSKEPILRDIFVRKFWSFDNMFSFQGRMRRKEFWLYQLLWFGISFVLSITIIGIPVAIIAGLIASASLIIRRLHDLNLSAWFYFVFLIPFINIVLFILLGCIKGTLGDNEYGPETIYKE